MSEFLKWILDIPLVLTRPSPEETWYMYPEFDDEAVSAILIRETKFGKSPIYFVSKILARSKTRYKKIEKVALAVVVASQKLRRYFWVNSIVVRIDLPLRQMLYLPDLAGRLLN